MTLEFTGLRVINVENFGRRQRQRHRRAQGRPASAARCAPGRRPTRPRTKKDLRNVGPSISYKLRDAAGQAREFHNYMLPVDLGDGVPVFLLGMRDTPAEQLPLPARAGRRERQHGRLPAPARGAGRPGAARAGGARLRRARRPTRRGPSWRSSWRPPPPARWRCSPAPRRPRATAAAAGCRPSPSSSKPTCPRPSAPRAGEVLVRILNGALFELAQLTREQRRPGAAAARRAHPGLHDAGRAGAERRLLLSGARWPSS